MSDLNLSTTIGGNTIWSGGNLPLLLDGDDLFYKSFKLYSTFNKPTKADVGLSNVGNYGIATTNEAVATTTNTKYLTPLRLGEFFDDRTTTLTRSILSENTKSGIRTILEVYPKTETDDKYAFQTTTLTAGDGLNGGGTLQANRTINVDNSVVRTNANQSISGDTEFLGSAYLQDYFYFNDYDDNTKVSGLRSYVRDRVWNIRTNTGETGTASIDIDGSVTAGSFSGNGSGLTNLNTSNLSGTVSYSNLPISSGNVSNWNTGASRADFAYDRAVTGLSGGGNSSITITRYNSTNLNINTSHNHSAGDITSGTLSSSRLPTITTGMVNFANQSLNTNSNVDFNRVSSTQYVGNGTEIKIGAGESMNSMDGLGGENVHIAGEDGVKVYASSNNLSSGLNRVTTLIDTNGNAQFGGNVSISGTKLSSATNNTLNITSSSGTGYIGMTNNSWFHFYCDEAADGFYFDRSTNINGNIEVYRSGHGISSSGHYGSGRNLTNLNASRINTGTVADNYISKNFDSTRLATRYGITGGYGYNSGTGGNWGANIWAMGDKWAGNAAGTGFSVDSGQYGLTWLRPSHPNCNSISSEGLHIYRAGNLVAAIGYSGHYFDNDLRADSFRINSDIALKDNVKLYDRKTDLSKLSLKQWIWKDDENVGSSLKGKFDTGVIAQDVEEVFPTCVSTGGDGIKSVDYGRLGTHISLSLKDEISVLQSRIDQLENVSIWSLIKLKMKRLIKWL